VQELNIENQVTFIRFQNISKHTNQEQELINVFLRNYKNEIFKKLSNKHYH